MIAEEKIDLNNSKNENDTIKMTTQQSGRVMSI